MSAYGLGEFVRDIRAICAENTRPLAILRRVAPLAQRTAQNRALRAKRFQSCNAEQGYGIHLLHEEPDHSLAVFVVSWLPGRGTPPHNHGTWAVVAGIAGTEQNVFWKRLDDCSRPGYARVKRAGKTSIGPGQVGTFPPTAIHSVSNDGAKISTSLHVYGRHPNHTVRSQFDQVKNTELPVTLTID